MIPAQKIIDRMQHTLNTEVDYFEKQIDNVLDEEKSIPESGIQIRIIKRLSKEAADMLAKMYFSGGWQFDYKYDSKSEFSPASYNPQKSEETVIFLATIVTLKLAQT